MFTFFFNFNTITVMLNESESNEILSLYCI